MTMPSVETATESPKRSRSRKAKPRKEAPSPWINGRLTISVEQHHIDGAIRKSSSGCAIAEAIKETLPDATFVSVDLQSIRFSRKGLRYCVLTPHVCQALVIGFDQADIEACKPITFSMRPCTVTRAGKRKGHTPTNEELEDCGLKLAPEQPHLNAENRASPEAVRAFVGALNGEPVLEPQPEPSPEAQSSDKLCVGCGTTLSWQDAQKSMSALIAHGRTPAQARKHSPRCERCIKALIGGHDGEAALAATMRGVRGPDVVKRKPRQPRAKVSKVTRGSVPVTLGGRMPPVSVLSRREWGLRALRKYIFVK